MELKMKKICALILIAIASQLFSREITDLNGRKLNVEVLALEIDRVKVLRIKDRREFWVDLDQLILSDKEAFNKEFRNKSEPTVHFEKMNEILGADLFIDFNLWDDPVQSVAKRLKWPLESETESQSSYRYYPKKSYRLIGERPYSASLYGSRSKSNSLSIVFANKGDLVSSTGRLIGSPEIKDIGKVSKRIKDLIEDVSKRMELKLTTILGEPIRTNLGSRDLKERVSRWDWGKHAIMLSEQKSEYVSLRIMSSQLADNKGMSAKIRGADLKTMLLKNVVTKENGDVFIKNIPMVDQGPKGYCVPATFERYLRYMGIFADMYVLAMAGNSGMGGGTNMDSILEGTQSYVSQSGRNLETVQIAFKSIRNISSYIDDGYPLMWGMSSGKSYNDLTNQNTLARKDKKISEWKALAKDFFKKGEEIRLDLNAGHICLIIGYNKETKEIAVSDSWGNRYQIRWIPLSAAKSVSHGYFYIIDR